MNKSTKNGEAKSSNGASTGPVNGGFQNGSVLCKTRSGVELRGKLIKLTRLVIAFEIYDPGAAVRLSEILDDFKIFLDDREAYSGKAVVSNVVQTAALTVCEVKLDEPGVYVGINMPFNGNISFLDAYQAFFGRWQNQMKLLPEFKMVVLDIQSYLSDLKLLLEQVEISIIAHPSRSRAEIEPQVFRDLAPAILTSVDALHERFEEIARRVEPELRGPYQALVHRQLHPLFLCAPFGHRTYHKPLGYAGDYEIMNMIHRNTFEGESLYAKMVHYWLVNQWAAKSVRNRVAHMKIKLLEETARVVRKKRVAKILNLGCGPAREVQQFISEQRLADEAEFTLLDFDAETLNYASSKLEEIKNLHKRQTRIHTKQMSVTQLVKYMVQPANNPLGTGFDLIYCGGLFDYLSDQMCRQLVALFYEWLAPDGLVVVANMNDQQKPFRHMVEFLLDWHLIYRDSRCMASFAPEKADNHSVISEPLGVNLFLEARKLGGH
ncbi:MAG TPA: class I SAM-dependent methyltransferase [Verrucomicrobiae bacterium]|nr:class I SAM-dependent methyltransferase [Verrucomicrobiae bacterium]